jgi:protein-L-isoaspartate O-methyltransferase
MLSPVGVILVAAVIVFVMVMVFLVQGPPYVPSDDDSAAQMLRLVKTYKPRRILDMGSGDGKLVVLLARQGYRVDGVELKPWLVWRSRRAIKRAGLGDLASVRWGNFWSFDASGYDLVILYAIAHAMPRLERKLTRELRPGAVVISNYFVFPNLKPVKRAGRAKVYKIT